MPNHNHLAAALAARAHPDAVANLAAVIGPRPATDPVVPPLTGDAARRVGALSARWAIATITSCEDHDTQRELLANERRSTVLAAACRNRHLADDVALELLRWAVAERGRAEDVWSLANHTAVPLAAVLAVPDAGDALAAVAVTGRRWDIDRFTAADVTAAIGSHTALAAAALAAAAHRGDGPDDVALRTEVAHRVAARDDAVRVVARALDYPSERDWDTDLVGPLAGQILTSAGLARRRAGLTDEATTLLWRELLAGPDRQEPPRLLAKIRSLPLNRSAVDLALALDDPEVATEVATEVAARIIDLEHADCLAAAAAAAGALAIGMGRSRVRQHPRAATSLLSVPLDDEQVAAALRCGDRDVTARWLSGRFRHNLPSRAVLADLLAHPGSCAAIRRYDDPDAEVPVTAHQLGDADPLASSPDATEAFRAVVPGLPGTLAAEAADTVLHRVAVELLADALLANGATPGAWELAAQLGADWPGSVEELVDTVLAAED